MTVPKLKDYFAIDVSTFLNPDEFAQVFNIDGVDIWAVQDIDSTNKHPFGYADGVSLFQMALYVDSTEIGYKPTQGQVMMINDERYTLESIIEEEGLYVLKLEANR
ncbi:hypothetical protein HZF08_33600 [Paenibacillus sp. CGMCC 1.16610]|uniref:ATP-binding sugar transporter Gifsy-2 n=1 Tax=Paenibacillus anseongense TaxID=2682845 RepID=A0ABW9U7B6_9BACL|nr:MULTISPECIES: hypothetical protein [Paenibacillus]MBA2943208.1 hypothetical protein [Paenibacillus sp. CGMCC 1.16610]MVQ33705.1 hypothetical protein [Paenibacillus anseongense]